MIMGIARRGVVLAVVLSLGACTGNTAAGRPTSSTASSSALAAMPSGPSPPSASPAETSHPTPGPASPATVFPPGPNGLPLVVESGPRGGRKVALTFDADMTPHMLHRLDTGETASYYNAALIEELRRLQVPATLFLTGLWMQQYPDVTRELAADPLFELGTHTWDHRAFTANCYGLGRVPAAEMLEEVTRTQRLLDELAGARSTKLFRFPGGCYDDAALRAIAPSGVTVIQFDVPGGDGFQDRPEPIIRTVVNGAQGGSIVVLHMNGGNTSPRTADAIGPIVEQLRARGYTLTTVSGLFPP
jgi:peptidoglycan-N-acetylglucosamine deacetylase